MGLVVGILGLLLAGAAVYIGVLQYRLMRAQSAAAAAPSLLTA